MIEAVGRSPQYGVFADEFLDHAEDGFFNACGTPQVSRWCRPDGIAMSQAPMAHAMHMRGTTTCALCGGLTYPVAHTSHWIIALNLNQNLLGKVMIVANRHVEDVVALTPDEWASLHGEVDRVERALDQMFAPDLYNLAFLMNVDRHVHLHVVPRYRHAREWHGVSRTDPHFGSLFGTERHYPSEQWMRDLVLELQGSLARPLRG